LKLRKEKEQKLFILKQTIKHFEAAKYKSITNSRKTTLDAPKGDL
jgi:hypothetical protein